MGKTFGWVGRNCCKLQQLLTVLNYMIRPFKFGSMILRSLHKISGGPQKLRCLPVPGTVSNRREGRSYGRVISLGQQYQGIYQRSCSGWYSGCATPGCGTKQRTNGTLHGMGRGGAGAR